MGKTYQIEQSYYDKCPKCGNENVKFGTLEVLDLEEAFFPADCPDCGFAGRQWVKIRFDMWQEEKENGDFEDIEFIPAMERGYWK